MTVVSRGSERSQSRERQLFQAGEQRGKRRKGGEARGDQGRICCWVLQPSLLSSHWIQLYSCFTPTTAAPSNHLIHLFLMKFRSNVLIDQCSFSPTHVKFISRLPSLTYLPPAFHSPVRQKGSETVSLRHEWANMHIKCNVSCEMCIFLQRLLFLLLLLLLTHEGDQQRKRDP